MRTQKEAFDVQLQDSRKHSLVLSEVCAGAACVVVLKSHGQNSRTLMSLSAEFERSFSARLNSGLQLLENRLSESLDTSVGTCIMGIGSGADHLYQDKMWQQISLMEGGLFSAMTASRRFMFFASP
jgi:hypothetical protein